MLRKNKWRWNVTHVLQGRQTKPNRRERGDVMTQGWETGKHREHICSKMERKPQVQESMKFKK